MFRNFHCDPMFEITRFCVYGILVSVFMLLPIDESDMENMYQLFSAIEHKAQATVYILKLGNSRQPNLSFQRFAQARKNT